MACIYMYEFPNGKRYIGQTLNFRKRHNQHLNSAFNPKDPGYKYAVHRAMRKYGIEKIKIFILEDNVPENELNNLETKYIEQYKSFGEYGYNMTAGGDGAPGHKFPESAKLKLSAERKGTHHEVSEETRKKISEAKKGKPGRKKTEAEKQKISEHNARAVAKKITFENSGEYRGKHFDPSMIFESVAAAARYFGVKPSTMSSIVKGLYCKKSNIKIIFVE